MRIMVVCHTYMVDEARGKFVELLKISPEFQVTIVCPDVWPYSLYTLKPEPSACPDLRIAPMRTLFAGREGGYFYFPNLSAAMGTIKPDILQVEHGTAALCYLQLLLSKRLFVPQAKTLFFTWVNWWYEYRFPRNLIERFNLQHSDYAIVGNQDAASILRKKKFTKPIKVLPQWGVDPDLYRARDVVALREKLHLDSYFTIGFVGRLVPEKGLSTLLSALGQLRDNDWKLLVVGSGASERSLVDQATTLGILDRLVFAGAIAVRGVPDYINCMDVLVLPSESQAQWREQFGHVLIEAMACEIPVIASTCGELPNVVGDAGLVFPEGDVEKLGERLALLIRSPEQRRGLARRGRERVLQKYTHRAIAEELRCVYQELIGENEAR